MPDMAFTTWSGEQDTAGSEEPTRRCLVQPWVRDPLESLDVLDMYPAAPQLDDPSLLQKGEGLGHGLALGADHGR